MWLDENKNIVQAPDKAVKAIVRKLDDAGKLISESFIRLSKG